MAKKSASKKTAKVQKVGKTVSKPVKGRDPGQKRGTGMDNKCP